MRSSNRVTHGTSGILNNDVYPDMEICAIDGGQNPKYKTRIQ